MQGGALALHGALTYPHKLGGMVCFGGFPPSVKHMIKTAENTIAAAAVADAAVAGSAEPSATAAAAPKTPAEAVPNASAPLLVVHGGGDEAVSWAEFAEPRWEQLKKSVLGRLGLKPTVRLSPPMGHWLGTNELMDVQSWVSDRVKAFDKAVSKDSK